MVRIAMILSGCGHLDGAEIREAVLSLLFLDQQGAQVDFFAPDMPQRDVVDHQKGKPASENRNVLTEAARIARGRIKPLTALDIHDYQGLVIPGGYGVAKNLSDFALKGESAETLPDFKRVIVAAHAQKKPIAAICIAPAVLALALRGIVSANLTIGDNPDVAAVIEACGSKHVVCATNACVADEKEHIVTCSAYMHEAPIADIADGIEKTIAQLVTWAKQTSAVKAAGHKPQCMICNA